MDDIIESQEEQETKEKKSYGWWNNYENCWNEALKCSSRTELARKSPGCYAVALKNGWLDEYTWLQKPEPKRKWGYNEVLNEAHLYISLKNFTWLKRRSSQNLGTEDIPNSEE